MRGNPWLRADFDFMMLGFEASSIVTLRAVKMARGGRAAEQLSRRGMDEEIDSFWDLQLRFLTNRLGTNQATSLGTSAPSALGKTVTRYRH